LWQGEVDRLPHHKINKLRKQHTKKEKKDVCKHTSFTQLSGYQCRLNSSTFEFSPAKATTNPKPGVPSSGVASVGAVVGVMILYHVSNFSSKINKCVYTFLYVNEFNTTGHFCKII